MEYFIDGPVAECRFKRIEFNSHEFMIDDKNTSWIEQFKSTKEGFYIIIIIIYIIIIYLELTKKPKG